MKMFRLRGDDEFMMKAVLPVKLDMKELMAKKVFYNNASYFQIKKSKYL
jgi:hypothetical protein